MLASSDRLSFCSIKRPADHSNTFGVHIVREAVHVVILSFLCGLVHFVTAVLFSTWRLQALWRGTGGGQLIIFSFGWQVFVLDLLCQPTVLSPPCLLYTVRVNVILQEELAEPEATRG